MDILRCANADIDTRPRLMTDGIWDAEQMEC